MDREDSLPGSKSVAADEEAPVEDGVEDPEQQLRDEGSSGAMTVPADSARKAMKQKGLPER